MLLHFAPGNRDILKSVRSTSLLSVDRVVGHLSSPEAPRPSGCLVALGERGSAPRSPVSHRCAWPTPVGLHPNLSPTMFEALQMPIWRSSSMASSDIQKNSCLKTLSSPHSFGFFLLTIGSETRTLRGTGAELAHAMFAVHAPILSRDDPNGSRSGPPTPSYQAPTAGHSQRPLPCLHESDRTSKASESPRIEPSPQRHHHQRAH